MPRDGSDLGPTLVWNPGRRTTARGASPTREPLAFHRRLPGYRPTRLVRLHELSDDLGLDGLWIKDESYRLGLPAFKVLGVSWAVYRALSERLGEEPSWTTAGDLRSAFSALGPLTLVSATSGNHGRAVARVARWFGLTAQIFTPSGAPADRVAAIASEGATVTHVDGTYDDAVERAAACVMDRSGERALLISDAAIAPGERVPGWIVDGYSTLFWELEKQFAEFAAPEPDLVVIQIGVGSLAAAAARHFQGADRTVRPVLLGVEPRSAACLLESARVGAPTAVAGPHVSVMYCLNAGRPTCVGFNDILKGFDAFIGVGDDRVGAATRALARAGVLAGPTGTAGLVGLSAALPHLVGPRCRNVLLLNTEGGADPTGYAQALQAASDPLVAAPRKTGVMQYTASE